MRRAAVLMLGLFVLGIVGLVFGQDSPPEFFSRLRQLGGLPPASVRYDAVGDQLALVQTDGSLSLMDATTLETRFELYESGTYNAYRFSHSGRWLALAIDRRVELWNTENGSVAATIEPPGSNYVTGPLMFSDDDSYLVFTAVVPASQATRRSENDTDLLPWLWDVNAALDLGDSRLPGRVDAYAFFDYRSGSLFMGPSDILLAAIPGRYQLIDAHASALVSFQDIESERFENDPVSLWFSAAGNLMYVLKTDTGNLVQVDTRTRAAYEIPLGRALNALTQAELSTAGSSGLQHVMGQSSSEVIPFVRTLFGYDYRADWNYHPLTITLLDILQPATAAAGRVGVLLYLFDETRGVGSVEFLSPAGGQVLAVHPGAQRIALREVGAESPIAIYELEDGRPVLRFDTAISDLEGNALFAYDATGESILAGWQRYDAASGRAQYEILDFTPGFQEVYFTDDSRRLVTMTDTEWWLWDIETGSVLRRERLSFTGPRIENWPDGHRFLVDAPPESDFYPGIEIYDVAASVRRRLQFNVPADMSLQRVIPSPSWESFLVVYAADPSSQHAPNGAVAVYTMGFGQRAYIAGTDLPANAVDFGWIDDQTAYVVGSSVGGAPDRIYGIEYDSSGVPACLLANYPDLRDTWGKLWERIAFYRPADDVARLAQQVCRAPDEAAALALHTPTPTLTPAPEATSALVRIAGVPECLTERFTDQALAFSREWRTLTEGLSAEQIEELGVLLCEGLSSEFAGGYVPRVGGASTTLIYAINVTTGARVRLPSLPERTSSVPDVDLVREAFRRQYGVRPSEMVLSPNRQLAVVRSSANHAIIYRLEKAYDTMVAEATATAVGTAQAIPNAIRIRPTATPLPDSVGTALPTLTPTVIPTRLPFVEPTLSPELVQEPEEICPYVSPVSFADRSATFAMMGRLLGTVPNSGVMWALDMSTGHLAPDETLPPCALGLPCDFSWDNTWMLTLDGGVVVSRPDGSVATVLMAGDERDAVLQGYGWYDKNRVYLDFLGYVPEESQSEQLLREFYNVETGEFSASEPVQDSARSINGLPTEFVSRQPLGGSLVVVRTALTLSDPDRVNGGGGYRYFLYDLATDTYQLFAETRIGETAVLELNVEWDPTGRYLYYTPPRPTDPYVDGVPGVDPVEIRDTLMVYDSETSTYFSSAPFNWMQTWTLDGQFRYGEYSLDADERQERLDTGRPVPSFILRDPLTGQARVYCPPESWWVYWVTQWSPDGRFVAFLAPQPGDQSETSRSYFTVYVLDVETGEVVDMGADMNNILVWTAGEGEYDD
ncbi:MAG: hypothetical protein IPK19_33505 [Chloroflexi bacterium]|nr:hypothetical protein [Chloroflexota bacterium]